MSTAQAILTALAGYDLREEHAGRYRLNSPLRPGSNSHGFSLKIEDDEHGTWIDHVSGESGSLYELAQRIGVALPERVAVANSKRAYASLAEYAEFKGVPAEAFTARGWSAEVITHDKRPAIEFKTRTGKRYRFIDGEKPPFKSEYQYKSCWYGLDAAIKLAGETDQPLVICNGEPSTVVAQHFGVAACTITGGEAKNIPPELMDELQSKWRGGVLVALDCDATGKKGAAKYAAALAERKMNHAVLDLGLSTAGDLADFCKLNGTDSRAALAKLIPLKPETVAKADAPDIRPIAELLSEFLGLRKSGNDDWTILERIARESSAMLAERDTGKAVSMSELIDEWHAQLLENIAHPNEIRGFRTHMKTFDGFIGGWQVGRLHVLMAETGTGKTTVAASIISNLIDDAPGIVVPTEGTPRYWLSKLVAVRTGVNTEAFETGAISKDEQRKAEAEISRIGARQAIVYDKQSPTPAEIRVFVERQMREIGAKWLLIDSLSNLSIPGAKGIFDTATAAADFALEMTRLGLCVIATAQVGRNLDGRANKIPDKHSAKGSGRIEDNADVLLALYNHNTYVRAGEAEENPAFPEGTIAVYCLKHRHKGSVEGRYVNLTYKPGVGVYELQVKP